MLTQKQKEQALINFDQYNPTERKNIRLYGEGNKDWDQVSCIDHRHRWMPYGTDVRINTFEKPDTTYYEMRKWCLENTYLQSWLHIPHIDGVQGAHQFLFEHETDAFLFKLRF
jgi:hypothetical protein